MARSKKDGRQGAGHRKWKLLTHRRTAQRSRRQQLEAELTLSREEEAENTKESWQELESTFQEYYEDFLGWNDRDPDDSWEYDYSSDSYSNQYIDTVIYPEDKYAGEPEPPFTVFLAVDRAVRQHGINLVREQAHILAAALDVSVFEIFTCIRHTRAGYIHSWV